MYIGERLWAVGHGARTTTNLIDLAGLCRDSEAVGDRLKPIMQREAFIECFEDHALAERPKQPISRGMAHHAQAMRRQDIVGDISCASEVRQWTQVVRQAYLCNYIYIFLTPKKNGTGRLIGDARSVNRLQKEPPNIGLPKIHDFISNILSQNLTAKCDGEGYLYQFGLHPDIQPFFKARLAPGRRGAISQVMFKRMPMGWKYAPEIAQTVSNFLVRGGVGSAWLDDFISSGV